MNMMNTELVTHSTKGNIYFEDSKQRWKQSTSHEKIEVEELSDDVGGRSNEPKKTKNKMKI